MIQNWKQLQQLQRDQLRKMQQQTHPHKQPLRSRMYTRNTPSGGGGGGGGAAAGKPGVAEVMAAAIAAAAAAAETKV